MFEKEAEDKAFEKYPLSDRCDRIDLERNLKYEEGFQDGAEFGYNKANEWHYVKDELPHEDVPLICVKGGSVYVAWYWDNIYHNARCRQVKKPYAWKEIVLPKESE
jgi:hypothetical protein